MLGASYLSLQKLPDTPTFTVFGGAHVQAGMSTAFRVRATWLDANKPLDVRVHGVKVAGVESKVLAEGNPAIVRLHMPADLGAAADVVFDVEAAGRRSDVTARVPVLHSRGGFDVAPTSDASLPKTSADALVKLVPEAGHLVRGMDNRVFVQVRSPQGAPLKAVDVTIRHPALAGGETTKKTDVFGLAEFQLEGNRPSFRLKVSVERKSEVLATLEEQLVPAGRQAMFRGPQRIIAGNAEPAVLTLWKSDRRTFCDLLLGSVWLDTYRLSPTKRALDIPVGNLAAGRYDLQCYFNPIILGTTWATTPLHVTEGNGKTASWLDEAAAQAALHPDTLKALRDAGPPTERLESYLRALLLEPPLEPTAHAATRADDMATRADAWSTKKLWVLLALGGVFVLVLLLVFYLILQNIITTRDRMRQFAVEAADDGPIDDHDMEDLSVVPYRSREGLARTRGLVLVVLVGGTLIANAIGFLALMALIK